MLPVQHRANILQHMLWYYKRWKHPGKHDTNKHIQENKNGYYRWRAMYNKFFPRKEKKQT